MSKKILGLNISSDAVTAVLLISSIKGTRLENAVRLPFQEEEDWETGLDRCLETIQHSMDSAGAVCVAAVPPQRISFRNLRLPFSDERKIRQILPFEIEPFLPGAAEDLVIDFRPIPANGAKGPTQILTAAADRSRLGALLEVMAAHHLDPEIVTVSGYAEAVFLAAGADRPGCWFSISAERTYSTMCIGVDGDILLVRRIRVNLERENGVERLCRQLEHARLFCENLNSTEIRPEVVYLSGEPIFPETFEESIEQRYQCPAKRVDFLNNAAFKWAQPPFSSSSVIAAAADSALAPALVELSGADILNFRRGPFALRKKWLEYKGHLLKTGVLLLFVLLVGFFQLYTETRALEREVRALKAETRAVFTSAFPDVQRIVDPVQQMRVKLEEMRRQLALAGASEGEKSKIDLLRSLSSRIPPTIDVEVTRLVMGPDSILLSGSTSTFNAVDEIKSALEIDPSFQSVTINSANLEKSGERVNFKIRVEL